MKSINIILILLLCFFSCSDKKDNSTNLSGIRGVFYDQNGREFNFPKDIDKRNFLISFVFTHCPDICPLTTHNIDAIKKKSNLGDDFIYLTLTFDPRRDNVFTLKSYIDDRGYDTNNWYYLTGEKKTVDSIMSRLNYYAIPSDTTITDSKDTLYYFTHTDKLFLINKNLELVSEYKGSNLDINQISKDIKKIGGK